MRRLGFIGLISLGLLSNQCSDDPVDPITFDKEFTVENGSTVTLKLENSTEHIDIQVKEIEEARCPSDVNCVRFGEVKVQVGVSGVTDDQQTLDMCIGDCLNRPEGFISADTMEVKVNQKDYAIILKDVTPYPTTTNGNLKKKAVLQVIKFGS